VSTASRREENAMTDLSTLVDLDHGLISPQIFIDDGLYRQEQERVFARSWLFLAHESQLKKPGDFFATYMGQDPVLLVRQRDGSCGRS
jgi:phenylpropionate dioxygenase-like ring-hydroxylating dioxygenase large terminal subunit